VALVVVAILAALFVAQRWRPDAAAPGAVAGSAAGQPGSATPEVAPLRATAERTVLDERFTTRRDGWPNDPQSVAWFAGGGYHLFARRPGQFVALAAPLDERFRDVTVNASFHKAGGPPGGGYGLIVRDQNPTARNGLDQGGRYYVFEVGDRGEVGLWRREDDRWIDIIPWTRSAAARAGTASNLLTVRAADQQLTFLVNGMPVISHTDTVLLEGGIGVFVGGDGNEVVLERLTVEVPRPR
jgi:hypothetical protein